MNDQLICRYPLPEINSLPQDLIDQILEVQEKAGFIPNVFLSLAYRPDEFRAFFAYYKAVMEREASRLSVVEKEMIIVATSAANGCQYCVVAHGALLRIFSKQPELADQVATNFRHAQITEREKAMLRFAVKLARTPELLEEQDFDEMKAQGFDAEDILDISGITALFGLSNRMAIATGLKPNPEFYAMAREAKQSK